jgi:hypothetical protein
MKKPSWTDVADAYEQRHADLLKSVMDACEAAGVANLADLLAAYDSAKKGRSVLLEEVRAWRYQFEIMRDTQKGEKQRQYALAATLRAVTVTDNSGLMVRAKEAK